MRALGRRWVYLEHLTKLRDVMLSEAKHLGRRGTPPQVLRRIAPQHDMMRVWLDVLKTEVQATY
jgi:hypothetical protein